MSNLEIGDRVRHNNGSKGVVLSIHPCPERYIRVRAQEADKEIVCVWGLHNIKPIVTVRG